MSKVAAEDKITAVVNERINGAVRAGAKRMPALSIPSSDVRRRYPACGLEVASSKKTAAECPECCNPIIGPASDGLPGCSVPSRDMADESVTGHGKKAASKQLAI